jgi:hypothetical protein
MTALQHADHLSDTRMVWSAAAQLFWGELHGVI